MYLQILWNRFAFYSLLFLVIQQIIVASSTFWITNLSEAVVNHGQTILYLSLFVSSLFLVYIPGIVSGYTLEKAKSQALYQYTLIFSDKYKCLPEKISDKDFQGEKEPWLTNESGKTIEETYGVAYDSAATGLNAILNIIALCLAIDDRFIIGYLASFIILPITSNYFKNKLSNAALRVQNDRKGLSQILLTGWDNIIIGNIYNFSIWWKQYAKRWSTYNQSSAKAVFITQIASATATIFALIPVAGIFLWIFLTTNDIAKIAALVATLPRQIQIIQHFEILSTYAMHWHGMLAKLKALMSTITIPNFNKDLYLARINKNEISVTINEKPAYFDTIDDFIKKLTEISTGRITIRGKNGSGKTTLINLIKKEFGDKAYYLPTQSKLLFEETIENEFSIGQRMKAYIDELINNVFVSGKSQYHIFLFDEWDANLDLHNKQIISMILDNLSKNHCTVEISHRKNS